MRCPWWPNLAATAIEEIFMRYYCWPTIAATAIGETCFRRTER
uniref:Uncharacterized protein n=1 Tax=Rhizophora mucronata TaxID=61149 RepID=A0A2P2J4D7_RHIMU